jgi:hypothetical protein
MNCGMPKARRRALVALGLLLVAAAAGIWLATLTPERSGPSTSRTATSTASAPAPATATAAPVPPPVDLPIRLPSPSPSDPVAPARFEGRVVSSASGEGVEGADLTFSRGGAAASVRTGPGGAFVFEPPEEGRWLLAAVTAAGFLPFAPEWGHSPVQLDARAGHQVRGVEIHLVPARELVGRVEDRDGKAIEGAAVRLLGAAAEAALVPIADRFTSDARGEFRFRAPEGAVLEARKDGFLPGRAEVDWVSAATGELLVVLGPTHRPLGARAPIAGRVVARGGAPIPGALVGAARERRFGGVGPVAAQAVAGPDGRFELSELEAGRYSITARAEGHAPGSSSPVSPGKRDVVVELGPGGRLRGCVRDAGGGPVAPFTLIVHARRSALELEPQRSLSVIDPSGCFALDDLAAGPAAVVAVAPGLAPSDPVDVEIPPPGGEGVVDLVLRPGGRLHGVVSDEGTGAPLAGARVGVEGSAEGAASAFPVLADAVTGADGRFELGGLPARVSIFVAAPGHHARVLGADAPPGARSGPVEVALRPLAAGETPRVDLAGIGAVLAARGEGLSVAQLLPGGGAAEAGLRRGDLVLRVDGRAVAELGMTGAIDAIRGPEGSAVLLTVRRGEETFDVRVARRLVRG